MSQRIVILSGVLLAQLFLVVWLFLPQSDPLNVDKSLLEVSPLQVHTIVISSQSEQQLTLQKEGDKWILPNYAKLPVDAKKIDSMLTSLEAKYPIPIANTIASQERFEVADNKFVRQIAFKNNNKEEKLLYVGQQAGLKKSYVRPKGADNVFEYPIAVHELSLAPKDWFDRGYLRLQYLKKITTKDFELENLDGEWQLVGMAENKQRNQENIDTIVTQLEYLNLMALFEQKDATKLEPKRHITVQAQDKTAEYTLYTLGEQFVIKADFSPHYFYVSKPFAESVLAWKKSSFEQDIEEG